MTTNQTTETQETATVECHGCYEEFIITIQEWDRAPIKRFYCCDACIYADVL
jgi:hypothetical protein